MRVLVSLHDVTPGHAERLARAETLLANLGVTAASYLLVPRYHGGPPVSEDASFVRWLHSPRPFEVSWFLHGFEHVESAALRTRTTGGGTWLKRSLLTSGEGEFLSLGATETGERIDRGVAEFAAAGLARPTGFVAPAWLFNGHLMPALARRRFRYSEDHRCVYVLESGVALDCPVITWSARTRLRRRISTLVTRTLVQRWRSLPALRVAVHPIDLDHQEIVDSIADVIRTAMGDRDTTGYDDFLNHENDWRVIAHRSLGAGGTTSQAW